MGGGHLYVLRACRLRNLKRSWSRNIIVLPLKSSWISFHRVERRSTTRDGGVAEFSVNLRICSQTFNSRFSRTHPLKLHFSRTRTYVCMYTWTTEAPRLIGMLLVVHCRVAVGSETCRGNHLYIRSSHVILIALCLSGDSINKQLLNVCTVRVRVF